MRCQRLAKCRPLQRPAQQAQGHIISSVPEIHWRVALCYHIGQAVLIEITSADKGVNAHSVHRRCLSKLHDGICQYQHAGLWQPAALPDQRIGGKQPCQMSAGRITDQCIVLRLHPELLCVLCDIAHSMAQIFHRAVVVVVRIGAVAQHKDCIAHFVQLISRGNALLDLCCAVQDVARKHQRILCVLRFCRVIVQLHIVAGAVLCDLLLRIQLVGHLHACVVVFDQQIQSGGAVLCVTAAHILFQRLTVVDIFRHRQILLLGVGPESSSQNAGILADLAHCGLRGNVGFTVFCRPCGQCQSQQHPDAHCSRTEFVFHCRASFFIRPVLPRTQLPPSASLRRLCPYPHPPHAAHYHTHDKYG